ncbi:MAG: urea transporter [Chitinophagaceae bacterium]|nr:urea transporter [Chitinophagaceae bacterium]
METKKNNTRVILPLLTQTFKGLGQVFLQPSEITGFFLLLGISSVSPLAGIASFIAALTGTITARLIHVDSSDLNNGLYGFNAALAGVASIVFFKPIWQLWLVIIAGAVVTVYLHHFFIRKKIPAFTFSFVLITWIIYYTIQSFFPDLLVAGSPSFSTSPPALVPVKGFAQVVFQSGTVAGIFLLIGVAASSLNGVLFGIVGSVIAAASAYILGAPADGILNGLFSYNAVLCAIAFAGKRRKDIGFALLAVVLSIIINLSLLKTPALQLTFPFVLASFIVQVLKNRLEKRVETE